MRSLQRDTNRTNTVVGRVSSTGVITSGTGFTITKSGLGVYIVRPIRRGSVISYNTTAEAGTYYSSAGSPNSDGSLTVLIFQSVSGAATDVGFSFLITQLDPSSS
jgi:hypothetical protein